MFSWQSQFTVYSWQRVIGSDWHSPLLEGWLKAGVVYYLSFVLKQKKQKFKALTSYATKYTIQLNDLNLPTGRQARFAQIANRS
ncbi:hypothetical protein Q766_16175 [Flavobacterium subsaxonicum WB 4.1-42 = DSM 21790]|uniref:Uncharacterized protein n=1 Tax=Flavobacterium subsaxonicum WB 4.1-42 = DSM 21790 TaxID=1121898 RepID=A0A0A2MHL7_9FLAO|nr:hypothetical protein Q766_16175 [Flavobacterium subsaxonicum WB 4.1-42 = DSM 21790]